MNSSLDLLTALSDKFPNLMIETDHADTPNGSSWLDLREGDKSYTIEVKPPNGYGLYYTDEQGIGSRPDEIYREIPRLLFRLQQLFAIPLAEGGAPQPVAAISEPHLRKMKARGTKRYAVRKSLERKDAAMTLKDIRELLGITQSQVALALGKQQSSISKIEQREDVLVSTLVSLIHSLGGQLEIKARFKDCELPIYQDRPAGVSKAVVKPLNLD